MNVGLRELFSRTVEAKVCVCVCVCERETEM